MSASMPSLLPEIAAPARRTAAARPLPSANSEAEPFATHLREDAGPRRVLNRPSPSSENREQAERPAKAERPEHPVDPRHAKADGKSQGRGDRPGTSKGDGAKPQASERAHERAADQARFKRDDNETAPEEMVGEAAETADPAGAATIAVAVAEQAASDPAVIVETALASDTDQAAEAESIAAQNDSALATATGAAPIVAPVLAAATETPSNTASAPAADPIVLASAGSPGAPAVKAGEAEQSLAPALTGLAADTAPAGAAEAGEQTGAPASSAAPAPVTDPASHAVRNANAAEPSPRAAPHLEPATGGEALPGPKAHEPHGLHLHLQPATPAAAHAPAIQPPPMKAPDAMPVQAVPIAIGLKALEGAREFEIRLDPAELGRVDVKLSISEDGRVQASLVVDRVETLALLQRDARTLERAFDQAGLTADANSIQFSLRQDGDGQRGAHERFDDSGAGSRPADGTETVPVIERPAQLYRGFVRETAVDIRV